MDAYSQKFQNYGEFKMINSKDEYIELSNALVHELGNMMMLMEYSIKNIKEENPEIITNQYFKYLEEDCMKMKFMVLQSRELTNEIMLNKKKTNIKETIDGIVNRFFMACEENNIIIRLDCEQDIEIELDNNKIEQVISNIIKNSVEELKECDILNKRISIGIILNDEGVCITINNNGRIIEQEIINKIFQPYYTSKNYGTGIGLALSKKIIEAHNGEIKAVSNEKDGTTFIISLQK